jgi:hypothetical protein
MPADQSAYRENVFPADLAAPIPELDHARIMNRVLLERKGQDAFLKNYFSTLTRRHIGAARTRAMSPAAMSNCAS